MVPGYFGLFDNSLLLKKSGAAEVLRNQHTATHTDDQKPGQASKPGH